MTTTMIPAPTPMIRLKFECLLGSGALIDAEVGAGLCGILFVGGAATTGTVHNQIQRKVS